LAPSDCVIKLVALVDEEIVGFAELITYPHVPRHRHAGDINMICVHDKMQGKGIGRALMEAMVDLADQWLQLTKLNLIVWADNESAIYLYRQFGFVIEGTMTDYVFREGDYINAHVMGCISPHRRRAEGMVYQENYSDFG
jgi:putative acetyltransferase